MNISEIRGGISDYYKQAIEEKKQNFYSGFLSFLELQQERGDMSELEYQKIQTSLNDTNVEKTLAAGTISELMNIPIIGPLEIAFLAYLATLDIGISSKGMVFMLGDRVLKIALAYPLAKVMGVSHAKTFAALKIIPSAGILPVLGALGKSDPEFVWQYSYYKKEQIHKILLQPAIQSAMRIIS